MAQQDASSIEGTNESSTTAEASGEPVICMREVVKAFDGKRVLDGINLDVHAGETVVIMGGSGSGKSTMLRLMIGSLRPTDGTVSLFGQTISSMDEPQLNEVRKRFGILFQSGALFNSMTLYENVALPLREHTELPEETIDIIVKIKLEQVSLREHAYKYPAQISGGMKKRAGLARALSLDPQLLFYDEPSAGLDPVTSAEIDELIMDLSHQLKVTSVVVTHEMDSAFRVADRMAMLDRGEIIKLAPRAEFEAMRDAAGQLSERDALIRQFLRGDAEGPISQRRQSSGYEEDLLGTLPRHKVPRPSMLPSRLFKHHKARAAKKAAAKADRSRKDE